MSSTLSLTLHVSLVAGFSLASPRALAERLDGSSSSPPGVQVARAGAQQDARARRSGARLGDGGAPWRHVALCPDGRIAARYDGRSLQRLATAIAPDGAPGSSPAPAREGPGPRVWHREAGPVGGAPSPRAAHREGHVEQGENSETFTAGGVFLRGGVCRENDVVLSDHPFASVRLVAYADRALERLARAVGISWSVSGAVVTTADPLLAVLSGGTPTSQHRAVVQLAPSPRVVAHAEVRADEMGTYGRFGDVDVFRWADGILFFAWRVSREDPRSSHPGAHTTSSVWIGVVRPGTDVVATESELAVFRGG